MGELVNSFRELSSAHFLYAHAVKIKRLLNGLPFKI
jgi:hypothetical protein